MRPAVSATLIAGMFAVLVGISSAQEGGHYEEGLTSGVPVDLVYIRFGWDKEKQARSVSVRFKNHSQKTLERLEVNVFQSKRGPKNWSKGIEWQKNYSPQPKYVAVQSGRFTLGPSRGDVKHLTFERPQIKNLKTIVVQFRWYEHNIHSYSAKTFPVDVSQSGLNRCKPKDKDTSDIDIVGVKFDEPISSSYNTSAIIKFVNKNSRAKTTVMFNMKQRGINGEWLSVGGPAQYQIELAPGEMKNVKRQFNKRPAMSAFRVQAYKPNGKNKAEYIVCY